MWIYVVIAVIVIIVIYAIKHNISDKCLEVHKLKFSYK